MSTPPCASTFSLKFSCFRLHLRFEAFTFWPLRFFTLRWVKLVRWEAEEVQLAIHLPLRGRRFQEPSPKALVKMFQHASHEFLSMRPILQGGVVSHLQQPMQQLMRRLLVPVQNRWVHGAIGTCHIHLPGNKPWRFHWLLLIILWWFQDTSITEKYGSSLQRAATVQFVSHLSEFL